MNAGSPATRLVLADRVHALRGDVPAHANALLLRDGRVLAIGAADELVPASTGADLLDLRGCTITPGLTDAHIHLLEWAMSRRVVDLAACRTPEECAGEVGRALSAEGRRAGVEEGGTRAPEVRGGSDAAGPALLPSRPPAISLAGPRAQPDAGAWVRGRGWNPHLWGGAYPHRSALDAIAPDRPVVLQSHDMHALWVNGRALAEVGIGRDTPDPAGGHIVRDGSGEPTGVLLEMAAQLVARRMPPPSVAEAEAALVEGQAALHRLGITGVHAFPSIHLPEPDGFRLLQRLRQQDRLRLRVLQHIPLERLDDAIALGLRSGFGDEWLRLGAVKLFLDGALGSRTALVAEAYEGDPGNHGVEAMPVDDFGAAVRRAASAGIAAAVHAIGDAAVARALDVLSDPALALDALPHRIEHLQLCPPERLAQPAAAGIVASMQPAHLITDFRAADAHWGRRSRTAYAFRSLLSGLVGPAAEEMAGGQEGRRAGAGDRRFAADPTDPVMPSSTPALPPSAAARPVLAFGSDAPVEPVDPRLAFYAATTRQDLEGNPPGGWYPGERIGMEDVLRAYILGPAIASGASERQGHLAPGAGADFVAWDTDPLAVEGPALLGLRCVATVVGGEVVWREGE